MKGSNRKGSDTSRRNAALERKGQTPRDRERNVGARGEEHSRVPKGNRSQQADPGSGRSR